MAEYTIMAEYTKAHINDLEANPAWKEICERLKGIEKSADEKMEKKEPADNREGTGERRVARAVLALPEILRRELKR